jgi:hypothetical protein
MDMLQVAFLLRKNPKTKRILKETSLLASKESFKVVLINRNTIQEPNTRKKAKNKIEKILLRVQHVLRFGNIWLPVSFLYFSASIF